MSRFNIAVPILLKETNAPIFHLMQDLKIALPMAVGINLQLLGDIPLTEWKKRQHIRQALGTLSRSRRYHEAIIKGSYRFNADLSLADNINAYAKAYSKSQLRKTKYYKPRPQVTPPWWSVTIAEVDQNYEKWQEELH